MKSESGGFKDLLKNSGFQAFLGTQFLGALNDNLYKMIVSMRAVHVAANTEASGRYLSIAGAVFVIPFLLFSGYSGHLADKISKRTVLISVKAFEIVAMALGLAAFFTTRIEFMLVVLFLMALHSTVFSPAKYGIVPEMIPDKDLSRANAMLEMSTFVAIVLGTSVGAFLFSAWKDRPWNMGMVMVAIAITGFATSFKITRVRPSGVSTPFNFNPFGEVIVGTRRLLADRRLWLTVVGISYFWFLGLLFQMDLLLLGGEVMKLDDVHVGLMVTCLAIGIGVGSMLAGRLSGDKVELGLVPLGSIFMGLSCLGVYAAKFSYAGSMVALALLGVSSGLFIVPLNAYLQQRGGSTEKGRLIATNNFFNTIGLLLATATLSGLHDRLHISADKLILIFGVATLIATIYIVRLVPEFLVRFLVWLATHTVYKIRIRGQGNVPFRGPALLVSNHVTHLDGFLIGACIQRFVRFMVWKPYYELKALNWFFRFAKTIPVGTTGPRDVVASIRAARTELMGGHVVGIFAEGAITRTGNLLPFKRGMERIIDGLDVPIIPVHLDRLWGSIFSFEKGRFFWKWPKRFPYPVTVSFGAPMPSTSSVADVRHAIAALASDAVVDRKTNADVLGRRFIRAARKNWSRFSMADSSGRELTFGRALTGSLLIARWARNQEAMVGVLLPPSVGGALANAGLSIAGKTPVNLNFTAGQEAMDAAMEQCRIQTVLTSKVFLAKAGLERAANMVFLEDVMASFGPIDKARALISARLAPARMLVKRSSPDSLATVVFSSGSTGAPKGVMLSHYNIISNIEAMVQVFWIDSNDRIVGVLPLFHSFGFTVTLWLPLIIGCGVAFHPIPTDSKTIGELVARYQGTLLLSTPTFCGGYARKCTREQFRSLRYVLVGAEKLREPVAKAFEQAFGLDLLEGYGCTEMSPVVAVNAPNFDAGADSQIGNKPGTVGHPLPGVAIKVVDPETGKMMGPQQEGLLMVRGANRMLGYLGDPERTAAVIEDGWYRTGDLAVIDEEGFLRITDRLSRFSKIGGEMVPHLKIEEAAYGILGDSGCVVTGVPDERKGERLVMLYTHAEIAPSDLWRRLADTDLPRLWLPKHENIYQVDSLPSLGTGKIDLRGVKAKAESLMRIRESAVI